MNRIPISARLFVCLLLIANPFVSAHEGIHAEEAAPSIDGFTFLENVDIAKEIENPEPIFLYEYRSCGLLVRCEIIFPEKSGSGNYEILVACHGSTGGLSDRIRIKGEELAKKGYLVVMPTYRGEGGSEGEIEVAKGEVDDVLACIDLLSTSGLCSSGSIALIGSSHGALVAALAAARNPDISAVVCAYGVLDIVGWWYYLNETGQYEENELSKRIYGGGPLDHPDEFAIRSAIKFACDIKSPIFIVQGSADTLVPPSQSESFRDALERCGNSNYKYKLYDGIGHGFLWWNEKDRRKKGDEAVDTAFEAWDDILDFINESRSGMTD